MEEYVAATRTIYITSQIKYDMNKISVKYIHSTFFNVIKQTKQMYIENEIK